jgi:hypothetical protein
MAIKSPAYTQFPNEILDNAPNLKPGEHQVVTAIVRNTLGYHRRKTKPLSIPTLAKITKLSEQGVRNALKGLEPWDWIERTQLKDGAVYSLKLHCDDEEGPGSPAKEPEKGGQNFGGSKILGGQNFGGGGSKILGGKGGKGVKNFDPTINKGISFKETFKESADAPEGQPPAPPEEQPPAPPEEQPTEPLPQSPVTSPEQGRDSGRSQTTLPGQKSCEAARRENSSGDRMLGIQEQPPWVVKAHRYNPVFDDRMLDAVKAHLKKYEQPHGLAEVKNWLKQAQFPGERGEQRQAIAWTYWEQIEAKEAKGPAREMKAVDTPDLATYRQKVSERINQIFESRG